MDSLLIRSRSAPVLSVARGVRFFHDKAILPQPALDRQCPESENAEHGQSMKAGSIFVAARRFHSSIVFGTEAGKAVGSAKFRRVDMPYARQVDLAYAILEDGVNAFTWIGGILGLHARLPRAGLPVASLRLPFKPSAARSGAQRC